LEGADYAAIADLQSLAVGDVCESETDRQVDQVADFRGGADRYGDEVQVVAF
jgi:hypothetical protein